MPLTVIPYRCGLPSSNQNPTAMANETVTINLCNL